MKAGERERKRDADGAAASTDAADADAEVATGPHTDVYAQHIPGRMHVPCIP